MTAMAARQIEENWKILSKASAVEPALVHGYVLFQCLLELLPCIMSILLCYHGALIAPAQQLFSLLLHTTALCYTTIRFAFLVTDLSEVKSLVLASYLCFILQQRSTIPQESVGENLSQSVVLYGRSEVG